MLEKYKICQNNDECLEELDWNNRLAVAVSQKHAMNNPVIPNWKIYCFPNTENIFNYPVSMYMRVGHPLEREINEITQRTLEAGLLAKWAVDSRMAFKQEARTPIRTKKLTIENISLILFLCGSFLTFAVLAFIAELIVHRRARSPGAGRFWTTADWLIDGDRHFLSNILLNEPAAPPANKIRQFSMRNRPNRQAPIY